MLGVCEGYDKVAPRPTVCVAFLAVIAPVCVVVVAVVVVCSSTWSPAIFHPVSRSTTVLASS